MTQSELSEIQRSLGQLEAKLDTVISNQDDIDDRLTEIEKWKTRIIAVAGFAAAGSAGGVSLLQGVVF